VVATTGLALAGVLVAPAAQAAEPAGPPDVQPAPIAWGPCQAPGLRAANAECGTVQVPLDYDDPTGTMIGIAVSRIVHTTPDEQFQGVIWSTRWPGGSGWSCRGWSLCRWRRGRYD
jgi:hypothetical protein